MEMGSYQNLQRLIAFWSGRPLEKPVEKLMNLPTLKVLGMIEFKWFLIQHVIVINLPKKVMDLRWVGV